MRYAFIALAATIGLALVGLPLSAQRRPSAGPRSLAEVVALAEANGLYCTKTPQDDPNAKHVIVSTMPLDDDEAALVSLSIARDGIASCYLAWGSADVHFDPAKSAFWGDMFVHGDPAVVKALTGARLREQ